MRTKTDIIKALQDSIKYAKKNYPEIDKNNCPHMNLNDLKRGLKALAISNEICTLKWILGKGKLNCYEKEE